MDESFIEKINKTKLTDKNDVKRLWYNGHDGSYNHNFRPKDISMRYGKATAMSGWTLTT